MEARANNVINDLPTLEQLGRRDLLLNANLISIYSWKQKAIKLNADVSYKDADWNLRLSPTEIFTRDFPLTRFDALKQYYTTNNFDFDTYSNLFAKTNNARISMKLGAKYKTRNLITDLTNNHQENTLGKSFQNNNKVNETTTYFLPSARWYLKRDEIIFHFPFHLNWIAIQDRKMNAEKDFFAPVFSPSVEYLFNRQADSHFTIAYNFDYNFDRSNAFYEGFILTSNRNLTTSSAQLNQYRDNNFTFSLTKRNLFQNLDYYFRVKLSQIDYDLLEESRFNDSGLQTAQLSQKNRARRLSLNSNVKMTIGNRTTLDFRASYLLQNRALNLNGVVNNIANQFIQVRSKISYIMDKNILSLRPSYILIYSNLLKRPSHQLDYTLTFFQTIKKTGNLKLNLSAYHTIIESQKVSNFLLGIDYKQSIESIQTDFTLSFSNLTNNESFLVFNQNIFYEQFTFYRLRPRQVIIKASRNF